MTEYVPEWHVSVVVPVLVRGGTEQEALAAAVEQVSRNLRNDLDADYWLTADIGKVMASENLDDDAVDITLGAAS